MIWFLIVICMIAAICLSESPAGLGLAVLGMYLCVAELVALPKEGTAKAATHQSGCAAAPTQQQEGGS